MAGVVLMLAFLLTQYLRQDKEPLLPFAIFKDRNYSSITLVVAVVNFAILGLSLPLTIYLQSVLGLSAFEAGLTLLPQALISMLIAGPAGGLADRVGGKYILIGGLVLFAAGMGYVDWIADVNSGRWSFLPGLIVAGVGVGFTWTPLYNIAMRDVQPRVAGVAAGIFSTIQELGGVIAGAAVGALLQDRLAAAIQDEATQRAGQLPSEFRDRFLDGFRQGTGDGVEFGTNQAAGGVQATPGMPARVAEQLEQLAKEIFKNAFVEAMHLTLILPIAVVLLAVISCFAVRQGKVKTRPESIEQVEDAA